MNVLHERPGPPKIDKVAEKVAAAAARDASTTEAVASHTEAAEEALRELEGLIPRATEGMRETPREGGAVDDSIASIAYRLSNTIPENWIPYVPFHTGNTRRTVQLRQAKMVRNMEEQEPVPIASRSHLLKSSLDVHLLNEESVSRSARRVRLMNQRARWIDGDTYVWTGRTIEPGGKGGSSGLRFDLLIESYI